MLVGFWPVLLISELKTLFLADSCPCLKSVVIFPVLADQIVQTFNFYQNVVKIGNIRCYVEKTLLSKL